MYNGQQQGETSYENAKDKQAAWYGHAKGTQLGVSMVNSKVLPRTRLKQTNRQTGTDMRKVYSSAVRPVKCLFRCVSHNRQYSV